VPGKKGNLIQYFIHIQTSAAATVRHRTSIFNKQTKYEICRICYANIGLFYRTVIAVSNRK